MLQDREQEKKKEYSEREKVELTRITKGMTREDQEELSEADQAYLF
jgi:hypothetical protein